MSSKPTRRIEFLERASYRQRRFRDAARIIPLFAAVLMVLPLMWSPEASLTSGGMLYLFGLWIVLVVLAFALSRLLKFEANEESGNAPPREADT